MNIILYHLSHFSAVAAKVGFQVNVPAIRYHFHHPVNFLFDMKHVFGGSGNQHRTTIVNLSRIDYIEGNTVVVVRHKLPLAELYKAILRERTLLLK
jgi:hypothetical protein